MSEARPLCPSEVFLVLRYPEHYQRVTSNGSEIYIERPRRGFDKHFWVEAAEVDRWRKTMADVAVESA